MKKILEPGDQLPAPVTSISRRRVLAGMAGASLIATVPVRQAFAQTSVKVGVVLAKQGPFAQQAGDMAKGIQLAVEDLGKKVGGKPMEIVWLDEPNPQVAVQSFSKLVEQENAVAVLGGSSSPTSLAMGAAALQRRVPFISINAAAREVTGKDCNPFMFRMAASVPVYARAMAPHLLSVGKKWYIISGSYAFGEDVVNTFTELAKAHGATILGVDRAPVATTDYSSFVLKARAAHPEVLISGAPNVEPILKQVRELGLSGSMTVAGPAVSDTDLWSASPDSLGGIYGKTWYYNDPSNSPEEKAFVKRYIAAEGRPPSDRVFYGWHCMNLLSAAIEHAKSTDRVAITKALTAMKLSDGGLPFGFRDWDHQLTRRLVVASAQQNPKDKWDVLKVKSAKPANADELNRLFGNKAEVGCKMASI